MHISFVISRHHSRSFEMSLIGDITSSNLSFTFASLSPLTSDLSSSDFSFSFQQHNNTSASIMTDSSFMKESDSRFVYHQNTAREPAEHTINFLASSTQSTPLHLYTKDSRDQLKTIEISRNNCSNP